MARPRTVYLHELNETQARESGIHAQWLEARARRAQRSDMVAEHAAALAALKAAKARYNAAIAALAAAKSDTNG